MRIIHQEFEGVGAEISLAQAVVAVDFAAELRFCVVDVDTHQLLEADDPLEGLHGLLIGLLGPQIVSGGKYMTGVDAHPDPIGVGRLIDESCQVFEAVTDVRSLSSSGFHNQLDYPCITKSGVHSLGIQGDALLLADLPEVASGMKIEEWNVQLFGPLSFVNKRIQRFLPFFLIRITQIDEITVVGQHVFGPDSDLLEVLLEGLN